MRFYGSAERLDDGSARASWTGGQEVLAVAYDVMVPGYGTKSTNNLRLWESKPKRGFDLNSFNGDFRFSGGLEQVLIYFFYKLEIMNVQLNPQTALLR